MPYVHRQQTFLGLATNLGGWDWQRTYGAIWLPASTGCLHPVEPDWLDAGQLCLVACSRPWLGSAETPESAVSSGPGSLAAEISLVNDILVYD